MQNSFNLTVRVSWWMQIIQIIFALLFMVGSIFFLITIINGSLASLIAFLFFAFFAYFGWANAFSTIQITDEDVTVNVFYGRFRINWDEVDEIVLNTPYIALIGNGKRIVLSLAFAGGNSDKMLEFFKQQIEARKIVFEQDITPFPLTHHNARV
jgi:hypothetical protein